MSRAKAWWARILRSSRFDVGEGLDCISLVNDHLML